MRPEQKAYMDELRARNIRERAELRAALNGRRPDLLRELKRRHWLVEDETRRLLEKVAP